MTVPSSPQHDVRVCTPRFLPADKVAAANKIAVETNPDNRPPDAHLGGAGAGGGERLVVDRRVYWGGQGVRLAVGFLDGPSAALRKRILLHMNAWNKTANVKFVESATNPQVRIARLDSPPEMSGYWSYLGTDILTIPHDQPTMNLEAFTMDTPDEEFFRVVRHETGHTLGFPHEHMRKALIKKLDEEKVIAFYMRTQGWTRPDVIAQLLTPLESSSILGSRTADSNSIMCYQIPGHLTKDGKAIAGGLDIDPLDFKIAGLLYPKPGA